MSAKCQATGGEIEAERAAVPPKQIEVVACSTSAIEQPQAGATASSVFEQWSHEVPEAPKPEVTLFRERSSPQQMVHERNCSRWAIDTRLYRPVSCDSPTGV